MGIIGKGSSMPQIIYCWRCRCDLPMLTDDEWSMIAPHLANGVEQIKRYRAEHHCSLGEAVAKGFGRTALDLYAQLTGHVESNPNSLFHHRVSLFGPPCTHCGKPLRTPLARRCVHCGAMRS